MGATLLNISRDGALVLAEKAMVRAVPLLIRIDSPVRTGWVDAKVVRFGSNREIAVHFPMGCPDDLLLAGMVGIDLAFLVRNTTNDTTAFGWSAVGHSAFLADCLGTVHWSRSQHEPSPTRGSTLKRFTLGAMVRAVALVEMTAYFVLVGTYL
jgi:hypothetical protein